jgi:hypothetical protein
MPAKKPTLCGNVTINGQGQFDLPLNIKIAGGPTIRIDKNPAGKKKK